MDPIYVTGHRNPDTDSIVAAMAYAALRNAVGDREYEAACLGHVSDETQMVLDRFGFQPPKRIYNMFTQVRDLEFDTPPLLSAAVTVGTAWNILQEEKNISAVPITNEDGTLYGTCGDHGKAEFVFRIVPQPSKIYDSLEQAQNDHDYHVIQSIFNGITTPAARITDDGKFTIETPSAYAFRMDWIKPISEVTEAFKNWLNENLLPGPKHDNLPRHFPASPGYPAPEGFRHKRHELQPGRFHPSQQNHQSPLHAHLQYPPVPGSAAVRSPPLSDRWLAPIPLSASDPPQSRQTGYMPPPAPGTAHHKQAPDGSCSQPKACRSKSTQAFVSPQSPLCSSLSQLPLRHKNKYFCLRIVNISPLSFVV